MSAADYYAPGSYNDPSAPWNQSDPDEKEFDITCSQTLSKTVQVLTSNYIPGAEGVDYEPDGEGGYCSFGWHDPDDTSDTNWADEFHNNDYHTPQQLLGLFKDLLIRDLENGNPMKSERYTKALIEECDGWCEDECEFIEE